MISRLVVAIAVILFGYFCYHLTKFSNIPSPLTDEYLKNTYSEFPECSWIVVPTTQVRTTYCVFGSTEPDAKVVFLYVGLSDQTSAKEIAGLEEYMKEKNLKIINLAPAPYGGTDISPKWRVWDDAFLLSLIAKHLEIDEFYLAGISMGTPSTLAAAHFFSTEQSSMKVLGTLIAGPLLPFNLFNTIPKEKFEDVPYDGLMKFLYNPILRKFKPLAKFIFSLTTSYGYEGAAKHWRMLIDNENACDEECKKWCEQNVDGLTRSLARGHRNEQEGISVMYASTNIAFFSDWGFDISKIDGEKMNVVLITGEKDQAHHPSAVELLGEMIKGSKQFIIPEYKQMDVVTNTTTFFNIALEEWNMNKKK